MRNKVAPHKLPPSQQLFPAQASPVKMGRVFLGTSVVTNTKIACGGRTRQTVGVRTRQSGSVQRATSVYHWCIFVITAGIARVEKTKCSAPYPEYQLPWQQLRLQLLCKQAK